MRRRKIYWHLLLRDKTKNKDKTKNTKKIRQTRWDKKIIQSNNNKKEEKRQKKDDEIYKTKKDGKKGDTIRQNKIRPKNKKNNQTK